MDDATQKLVDGLRLDAGNYGRKMRGEIEPGETFSWDQSNVRAWEAADALEAAQRPLVAEPDNHHNADVCPFCTRNREEREAAIRAEAIAQRPPVSVPYVTDEGTLHRHSYGEECNYLSCRPVSPEAREELVSILSDDECYERVHFGGTFEDEFRPRLAADALLARFSFPSQPVYDEARAALLEWESFNAGLIASGATQPREIRALRALVAALRGGELTREETTP